jgi:hypothetical protein
MAPAGRLTLPNPSLTHEPALVRAGSFYIHFSCTGLNPEKQKTRSPKEKRVKSMVPPRGIEPRFEE